VFLFQVCRAQDQEIARFFNPGKIRNASKKMSLCLISRETKQKQKKRNWKDEIRRRFPCV